MNETQQLATHVARTRYADLPEKAVKDVKRLLSDWLGVCLGGTGTESGRIAAEYQRDLASRPESTIFGYGWKVSAPAAAMANSICAHSIELDDADDQALIHYGVSVVPAALAVAERQRASGQQLLTALVLGCDVLQRLNLALNPGARDRGFHTTSTFGPIGAAAACASLLGLTADQTASALGLAATSAGGLMEFYGTSMQKRFNPGPAAHNGVQAAMLAARGFTGASTILEGERGFARAVCPDPRLDKLTEGLGQVYPAKFDYKPYACARPIHYAIDCALHARKAGIRPEAVESIHFRRHPWWITYHMIATPRTYHEAQVSLPFSVAVALMEGDAFLDQYREENLKDPVITDLARRVTASADDTLPRTVSVAMELRLKNGEIFRTRVDYAKGSEENPFTPAEIRRKFSRLGRPVVGEARVDEILAIVANLDKVADVTALIDLMAGREGRN